MGSMFASSCGPRRKVLHLSHPDYNITPQQVHRIGPPIKRTQRNHPKLNRPASSAAPNTVRAVDDFRANNVSPHSKVGDTHRAPVCSLRRPGKVFRDPAPIVPHGVRRPACISEKPKPRRCDMERICLIDDHVGVIAVHRRHSERIRRRRSHGNNLLTAVKIVCQPRRYPSRR